VNKKQIITFKQGTLYLKLRESFDTSRVEVHCTLAEITRDGTKVVKADSHGEVSSTSMCLTTEEMALLLEGFEKVQDFWNVEPLQYRHVLLECGCSTHWNEAKMGDGELPMIGGWAYCTSHEEQHIYRFNVLDFVGEEATQPA